MKEISLESLPPCFEKWCAKFDNLWDNKGKKKGFRCYLAGLLGESNRKNIVQITDNIVGSSYHNVHHFLGKSKWNADDVNERRLHIMNKRNQTRSSKSVYLNSWWFWARKKWKFYWRSWATIYRWNWPFGFGSCFKTVKPPNALPHKAENGIVTVTTHVYDGVRSLPLDQGYFILNGKIIVLD